MEGVVEKEAEYAGKKADAKKINLTPGCNICGRMRERNISALRQ
jgi:hypothetical protein